MRKSGGRIKTRKSEVWYGWPYLAALLTLFLIGSFFGGAFAFLTEPSADLKGYLLDYFGLMAQNEVRTSFFAVLWDCIRWPLLTVVLGLTVLGLPGIPLLFAARGFLLTFAVCTVGRLLGPDGVLIAFALFAVTALLVLPVLFAVGCEGLQIAYAHLPNVANPVGSRYRPEVLLPGIGIVAVASALQWTVIPTVLSAICSRVLIR